MEGLNIEFISYMKIFFEISFVIISIYLFSKLYKKRKKYKKIFYKRLVVVEEREFWFEIVELFVKRKDFLKKYKELKNQAQEYKNIKDICLSKDYEKHIRK